MFDLPPFALRAFKPTRRQTWSIDDVYALMAGPTLADISDLSDAQGNVPRSEPPELVSSAASMVS